MTAGTMSIRTLATACLGVVSMALVLCSFSAQGLARDYNARHHIIIGLDLSKSNPLVDEPQFAAKVGRRIYTLLENLPVRSKVTLRTFGVNSVRSNPIELDWEIDTRRSKNTTVARIVSRLTAGVPELIASGRFEAQNFTNIIDFLETIVGDRQRVRCNDMQTIFVLATDGFEDSVYVKLREPGSKLPQPRGQLFAGCKELIMLGIGQTRRPNPIVTQRLHREWSNWALASGFKRFIGLSNW